MRIRIPRRFLLLSVLLCSLALVTSVPTPTNAKPIPWNPEDGPMPGDGDGPVVKGGGSESSPSKAAAFGSTQTTRVRTTVSGIWRTYLAVLRLGHGWRWLW
jgi:hypothetical protein